MALLVPNESQGKSIAGSQARRLRSPHFGCGRDQAGLGIPGSIGTSVPVRVEHRSANSTSVIANVITLSTANGRGPAAMHMLQQVMDAWPPEPDPPDPG